MAHVLEVKDLKTHFFTSKGVLKAVDGVSFDIKEKEAVGLVGESGCGKSTVAFSIMRLIPNPPGKIVDGAILLHGKDILKCSDKELHQIRGKEISMIFQDPMTFLNPVMRIENQIVEVLKLHQGMNNKDAKIRCLELLKLVRMPDPERVLKAYPHQISGGMKQRSLIAMSLACNPSVLIADEPTTALDTTIQVQILNLIDDLKRALGTSLLLVSHDLGIVAEICDRINVMYAGKNVEKGNVEKVYSNPLHPYTRGLIDSILTLNAKVDRIPTIDGVVPSLINPPKGCKFYDRCSSSMDVCKSNEPPFFQPESEHEVACWLYEAT